MIGEVLKNKYSCKENILEPKNCRLYIKHRFPKRPVTFTQSPYEWTTSLHVILWIHVIVSSNIILDSLLLNPCHQKCIESRTPLWYASPWHFTHTTGLKRLTGPGETRCLVLSVPPSMQCELRSCGTADWTAGPWANRKEGESCTAVLQRLCSKKRKEASFRKSFKMPFLSCIRFLVQQHNLTVSSNVLQWEHNSQSLIQNCREMFFWIFQILGKYYSTYSLFYITHPAGSVAILCNQTHYFQSKTWLFRWSRVNKEEKVFSIFAFKSFQVRCHHQTSSHQLLLQKVTNNI